MQKDSKKEILFTVFFFGGFILGILFVNLWGDTYFRENPVFGRESFLTVGNAQVDANAFFLYLLGLRGREYLLVWLVGYTIAGLPVMMLALCWLGFAAGVLLTMAVVQMHMAGILVFLTSILPQVIIYVPLVLMLAGGIYEKRTVRFKERFALGDWKNEKGYIFLMLTGLPMVVLGAALESYANLWLVRQVINYFF